ncbi:hypothetical protein D3C72_148630 [compost metagenome]
MARWAWRPKSSVTVDLTGGADLSEVIHAALSRTLMLLVDKFLKADSSRSRHVEVESMRFKPALPVMLAAALALTGCADLFGVLGLMGVTVTGQVRVPQSQLAAIGGFEAYRIAASFAGEVSVGANAEVQTYSLMGLPVANSTTRTDTSGGFRLEGVPADRVSVIRASVAGKNGKTLRLTGLVKASGGSTVTELSAVSTIVAEGLLREVGTSGVERMTQDKISELEHVVMQAATTADQNVDLSGAEGPASRFQSLVSADAEVRDLVASLKSGLTTAALSKR